MNLECNCLVCTAYKLGRQHAEDEKEAVVARLRALLYKFKFDLEQSIVELPPDPMNDSKALLVEIVEALDMSR